MGVIELMVKPTPLVLQVIITNKKDGSLRKYLDFHELTKVLLHDHYTMPILEDVLHDIKDVTEADLS